MTHTKLFNFMRASVRVFVKLLSNYVIRFLKQNYGNTAETTFKKKIKILIESIICREEISLHNKTKYTVHKTPFTALTK